MTSHVAVVGAGPAGLMAAETVLAGGARCTVFERMPSPARKFLMAGRGGLNLTHTRPLPGFLDAYGDRALWMAPYVDAFPPGTLRAWCEELGIETFVGSSNRIFPTDMKASPLLRAWLRRLESQGLALERRHTWTGFGDGSPDHQVLLFDTPDGAKSVTADAVVLALGGASWPRLGGDGSWQQILERAGVDIAPLTASNAGVRLDWSETFRTRFAGEPLKTIEGRVAGRTVRGDAVITRDGLEGGLVYALSADLRAGLKTAAGTPRLVLDLRPDQSIERLIQRLSGAPARQSAANTLRKAAGLSPAAIGLLREATANDLPKDAETLARIIKSLALPIVAMQGLDRAISSAGGITRDAVTDALMLKALPGVFVAGEMLDWDAPTGGYLLQASFATGRAAANGAAEFLAQPRCR
ncbi:MAG: TIGR03862 family flavoprotein [Pseudomonadota bacterium]